MEQWRFRISGSGWVCADCGADMVFDDDEGGVTMTHDKTCSQVAALRGASS